MNKNILLGGGLNSGKTPLLKYISEGNLDSESHLHDLNFSNSYTLNLTDSIRKKIVDILSPRNREIEFPKFGQLYRDPKPSLDRIYHNLGGTKGWIDAEKKEMEYLSRHHLVPFLKEGKVGNRIVAGVGISPEQLYQFLNSPGVPSENFYTHFTVKTNVDKIAERLEKDRNIEGYNFSWPLRMDNVRVGAEIIAGFGQYIAEEAQKRNLPVTDVSVDTDSKLIKIGDNIREFMYK